MNEKHPNGAICLDETQGENYDVSAQPFCLEVGKQDDR